MIKLKDSEIVDELVVCSYCYDEQRSNISCCDETHFDTAYKTKDGTVYLCSEVEVIKEEEKYYKDPMDYVKEQKEEALCREANGEV